MQRPEFSGVTGEFIALGRGSLHYTPLQGRSAMEKRRLRSEVRHPASHPSAMTLRTDGAPRRSHFDHGSPRSDGSVDDCWAWAAACPTHRDTVTANGTLKC